MGERIDIMSTILPVELIQVIGLRVVNSGRITNAFMNAIYFAL